jgi:hypothetical protein
MPPEGGRTVGILSAQPAAKVANAAISTAATIWMTRVAFLLSALIGRLSLASE